MKSNWVLKIYPVGFVFVDDDERSNIMILFYRFFQYELRCLSITKIFSFKSQITFRMEKQIRRVINNGTSITGEVVPVDVFHRLKYRNTIEIAASSPLRKTLVFSMSRDVSIWNTSYVFKSNIR